MNLFTILSSETDRMMIVNNQTYGDVWQSCLTRIREHTSDEEFAKWFKPIVPLDFDGVTLKLRCLMKVMCTISKNTLFRFCVRSFTRCLA